jgi:4'-phosphopantetheinyl transferase
MSPAPAIDRELLIDAHARAIPGPGVVDAWWLEASRALRPSPQALDVLSADELDRAAAYRATAHAHAFIRARAMLRRVLAGYVGAPAERLRFDTTCALCGAGHGKPVLLDADGRLSFSLSHARGAVVVAVSGGAPVGIDVEHRSSAATAGELAAATRCAAEPIGADALPVELLRHWTRKEALLKATGHGLAVALSEVTLERTSPGRWSVARAAHLDDGSAWSIVDTTPSADHVGAIALRSERLTIVPRRVMLG